MTTHLASKLQLNQEDKMRTWVSGLLNNNIIITQGIKKGTEYLLNPELFAQAKLDIIPSLKTLEPYKLEALILEDLKYNGESKLSDIKSRIPEALEKDIQKAVYKLVKENKLNPLGGNRNRTYKLSKKK